MRAQKYFNYKELFNLEDVFFNVLNLEQKLDYCLINEHQKCYYIGSTVNAVGLISRLRLSVMKAEYPIMAHNLQDTASVSQMSDWILAIFKPDFSIDNIAKALPGFTRILKAMPYEVNSREGMVLYRATHSRSGVSVCFSTVTPSKASAAFVNGRARSVLDSRLKTLAARGMHLSAKKEVRDYYTRVKNCFDHCYGDEWTLHELPYPESQTPLAEVKAINEKFVQHLQ